MAQVVESNAATKEIVIELIAAIPEYATADEIADKFEIAVYSHRELLQPETIDLLTTLLSRRFRSLEEQMCDLLDDVDEALDVAMEILQMARYRVGDLRRLEDVRRDLPRSMERAGDRTLLTLIPCAIRALELPTQRLRLFEEFVKT